MHIIGHRGAAGHEPENTLRSFRKAVALKVHGVEFDVQKIKTGELVVIHDSCVKRTTNGKGKVPKFSFKDLRKLDAGKGESIPTLEEVLNVIDKKMYVNIELKGTSTPALVVKVIQKYIKKGWSYDHFLVSSFKYSSLRKVRALDSQIPIGVLVNRFGRRYLRCVEDVNAVSLHPHTSVVTKRMVKKAHEKGLQVHVFTVNTVADLKRMIDIGVDGIFSDYPEMMQYHLQSI